jgi:adenine-specific DNA-methyltransferase
VAGRRHAGGAAFIVPIAREMVALWRADVIPDLVIVERIRERLVGREIGLGLARLANALIRRCLVREHGIDAAIAETLDMIREGDLLKVQNHDGADHEIGNRR